MCGFVGVVSSKNIDTAKLNKSDNYLTCRGPDQHKWKREDLNSNLKCILSFHRLSILDLSEEASQPMKSSQFDNVIMFNGEIYNHLTLRKEMEKNGVKFRSSHSDTETLLLGFSIYGDDFINKIEGQFAIVFIDKKNSLIKLYRDRLGQKPLYYSIAKDRLIFSSNFKSVLVNKNSFELDEDQITNFLEFGAVVSPKTFDKNIFKLQPGEAIEISYNPLKVVKNYKYWDLKEFVSNEKFESDKFFELFETSVNKRLLSDVPVATLLSGGIDSTSITKALSNSNIDQINSFSIKNKDPKYDESVWSSIVANKYNTNHLVETIDGKNLNLDHKKVIQSFDEPYSDPSIFPSFLIYEKISNNFKVAISGDGGDEILGGYEKITSTMNRGFLNSSIVRVINKLLPDYIGTGGSLSNLNSSKDDSFVSLTIDTKLITLLSKEPKLTYEENFLEKNIYGLKKYILSDYKFFLAELMLLKVDRTSMANSLEVRSPFLDHKLIEYMMSTDMGFYDANKTKLIMKEYLSEDFEKSFLNRKKMGFVFDLENWIYTIQNEIRDEINSSKYFEWKRVEKLFTFRTRINAIRILKIFTVILFLKEYETISN